MPKAKKKRRSKKLRRLLLTLLFLLLLLAAVLVLTPDEEIPPTAKAAAEGQVIEGLEIPASGPPGQIVAHTGYTLRYSEDDEQPYWVAYALTRNEVNGPVSRKDNFRADPAISTGSATLDDYRNSRFDRGHLAPAADLCYSAEAMDDSFLLSNMSPQRPDFNRGVWADLEAVVRNFAQTEGVVYVATGPVLADGPFQRIGRNKVSVPNFYYKAVLDYTAPEVKAIGFILPNKGSDAPLESFAVPIDEVEERTGLDFFPLLEDKEEARLEASCDPSLWDFRQFVRKKGEAPAPQAEEKVPVKATLAEEIRNVLHQILGEVKRMALARLRSLLRPILGGAAD